MSQLNPDQSVREQPIKVGAVFGEDVYMLPSAHEKLMLSGLLDQQKDMSYYAGNPEVLKLLDQISAEREKAARMRPWRSLNCEVARNLYAIGKQAS